VATASEVWQGFRHWRRRRPFWGGLLLLLAGVELFLSANLTLGGMEVHVGPQGFLSYLLPLMLLLCGLLAWFTPAQRLFYGILGLLTALYSMLGLNLGGFFVGMLIGIVGGALTISWATPRPALGAPVAATAAAPLEATDPAEEPDPDEADLPAVGDAETQFLPGFSEPEPASSAEPAPEAPKPPSSGGVHRKTFVIALVPIAVTAAVLIGGSHTPARADTCPKGMPSRSATPSPSSSSDSVVAKKKASTPTKTTAAAKKTSSAATKTTTPSPSASASAAADPSVLDDIKNGVSTIVDGVGKLLGVGDDPTPTPSASPSPTPSPSVTPTPAPTTSAPGGGGPTTPSASQPGGSNAPTGSASPSPSPTLSDIPCLGARVLDKVASADDVPLVTEKGGLLETDSLTMYDSTYDGVVTLNTATGTIRALKFSMRKAVNKPFKLTIPEAGGHTTLIESDELTTDGNVKFYTPNFQGKLFGLIPVTFTPEQPPPLTLPVLWFTDAKINLTFVRCDTLTAKPLKVTAKP
jgi:hypothetical protein